MKFIKTILILSLFFVFCFTPLQSSHSGMQPGFIYFHDTDNSSDSSSTWGTFVYFFDLRERETFIQLTYPDGFEIGLPGRAHIQIYDVSNNCNENNFFDNYTINDTHVYNMRDIQTNDGSPSGVVLPDGSYGIVVITLTVVSTQSGFSGAFGNMRIIDNNGYEYRTNAQLISSFFGNNSGFPSNPDYRYSFNFNSEAGVTLSDVVGINLLTIFQGDNIAEFDASDVAITYTAFDIDIYDLNEVPFSCRDVIFSCVDEDNPRVEELLETAEVASVASFEYGINNAIPHSKGGELLCPGNNITDGIVNLSVEPYPTSVIVDIIGKTNAILFYPLFYGYVGLNNGNGRGSFDSFWVTNLFTPLGES